MGSAFNILPLHYLNQATNDNVYSYNYPLVYHVTKHRYFTNSIIREIIVMYGNNNVNI